MSIIVLDEEEADQKINKSSINKLFYRNFICQTLVELGISTPLFNGRDKSQNFNKNLIKDGSNNSNRNTKQGNIHLIVIIILDSNILIKFILV
jgi:hypothetical protein